MHPGLAMLRRLYGEEMYDLVRQLLHPDLHQRFTAAQALEAPFLKRLAAEEVSPTHLDMRALLSSMTC